MHHAVMFEMAYDKQICKETTKGQIISEQICGVLKDFPKKHRNIARISALSSKMGQIKK